MIIKTDLKKKQINIRLDAVSLAELALIQDKLHIHNTTGVVTMAIHGMCQELNISVDDIANYLKASQ